MLHKGDTGENTNCSKNVAHWRQCCTLGSCTLGVTGVLQQITYSQSKDGILPVKRSFTFSFKIVYSQPYDPMFPILKDCSQCPFFCFQSTFHVSNLHFCFQSHRDVSNVLFLFPIYFNVSHLQCFQCMFPI